MKMVIVSRLLKERSFQQRKGARRCPYQTVVKTAGLSGPLMVLESRLNSDHHSLLDPT